MARRFSIRRVTTWVLVGLYGLVASGLPLPLGLPAGGDASSAGAVGGTTKLPGKAAAVLAAKDRSRPFPCMDKPCGCATAKQCFSNCCCHTPAERLAWARAHQVEPAVLAALERRVAVETAVQPAAEASCCSVAVTSCCSAAPGCGGEPTGDSVTEAGCCDAPVEDADPRRPQTLSLRAMLACGGLVAEWFAAGGGGALLPPRVGIVGDAGLVGIAASADGVPLRLAVPPDVPPPRC